MFRYAAKLDQKGIPVVGGIPSGMPSVTISAWTPFDPNIAVTAITCVVVGFMESVAIAKQLASIHGYEIDASMELVGLGVADVVGAMFQAYPVTGSFSRSAVNNECGASSGISAIVTATMVGLILLFLTPVFEIMVCLLQSIFAHCSNVYLAISSPSIDHNLRSSRPSRLQRSNPPLQSTQIRLLSMVHLLPRNYVPRCRNRHRHRSMHLPPPSPLRISLPPHGCPWTIKRHHRLQKRQTIPRGRNL